MQILVASASPPSPDIAWLPLAVSIRMKPISEMANDGWGRVWSAHAGAPPPYPQPAGRPLARVGLASAALGHHPCRDRAGRLPQPPRHLREQFPQREATRQTQVHPPDAH